MGDVGGHDHCALAELQGSRGIGTVHIDVEGPRVACGYIPERQLDGTGHHGETGLSEADAQLLFAYSAYGNLAVNRLLGWKRGPRFERMQKLLGLYNKGGLRYLKSETSPDR